jgi:hypothetical protein
MLGAARGNRLLLWRGSPRKERNFEHHAEPASHPQPATTPTENHNEKGPHWSWCCAHQLGSRLLYTSACRKSAHAGSHGAWGGVQPLTSPPCAALHPTQSTKVNAASESADLR